MNRLSKIQRYLPAGALGISILFHLFIFLGISGIIIIQAVTPKTAFMPTEQSSANLQDIPTPPDTPEEPTPDVPNTDPEIKPDTPAAPSFSIEQISSPNSIALPNFSAAPPVAISSGNSSGPSGVPESESKPNKVPTGVRTMANPFGGNVQQGDNALVGYMYDFKQTPSRSPSGLTIPDYRKAIAKFVSSGWDDGTLAKYYKVNKALAAYQIFIPLMKADDAPKAFNAEKYVQPKMWIIVYKGNFTAPATGTFRFVGVCDDILVVRLGGKTVLDGSLTQVVSGSIAREKVGGARGSSGTTWGGEWLQLNAGQSYPIEVIIGEEPGGVFYAFLQVQQKGRNYDQRAKNAGPLLPIFQMSPVNPPKYSVENEAPAVDKKGFISQGSD
ncbi:MAG: hypothetical protein LBH01_02985 [Verrucomicrobiales bacterium]|jgi:hypothetical protein|nr:hypothetical protein [Verrucomicrobiales bacterium]